MKDTVTIPKALATHNPFPLDTGNNLRNIMNRVNADRNVNADTAKSVGEKILSSMNGTLVTDNSFKRSAHGQESRVLLLTRKCATCIELTCKGNTEERQLCLTGTTLCQLNL